MKTEGNKCNAFYRNVDEGYDFNSSTSKRYSDFCEGMIYDARIAALAVI